MILVSLVISSLAFGSIRTAPIPRTPRSYLTNETTFTGGNNVPANIENLRSSWHAEAQFERWVFDFSDTVSRQTGKAAPEFQIRYSKAGASPKIVLEFKSIRSNRLKIAEIKKLLEKSHFVKDVVLYPPIEEGEVAIEFILKKQLQFSPHQPTENEGRLVLDIRAITPTQGIKDGQRP